MTATHTQKRHALRLLLAGAILLSLLICWGCSQEQRDKQADRVDQVASVLDRAMAHVTADNVDQVLDLVIQLAPLVNRDDLATRAVALQQGAADDAVSQIQTIAAELDADLGGLAADLRDPGTPTWQLVLNAVLGIGATVAGGFAVRGVGWANTARNVIAGVQGLTDSGALTKADRKAAMKTVLSPADEARIAAALRSDRAIVPIKRAEVAARQAQTQSVP